MKTKQKEVSVYKLNNSSEEKRVLKRLQIKRHASAIDTVPNNDLLFDFLCELGENVPTNT